MTPDSPRPYRTVNRSWRLTSRRPSRYDGHAHDSASSRPAGRAGLRFAIGALLLASAAGCQTRPNQVEILSFRDAADPVRYAERFDKCYYCRDAHGNWRFVLEIPPTWVQPDAPPESDGAGSSDAAGEPIAADEPGAADKSAADAAAPSQAAGWTSQLVYIEVFWVPYPGRTYAHPTQTNAAIKYHLVTPDRVLTYEGAGFVYFRPPRPGRPIAARIESASLLCSPGVAPGDDLFGPCRLRGEFTAVEDRRGVFAALTTLKRGPNP